METRNAYYIVRNKLRSLLKLYPKAKFIVTGHSIGGALAILFPAILLFHEETELMERLLAVYTFGQPRVGDVKLAKFMEAHVSHPLNKYFRVVYCNDLIPRIPYDDHVFLYKHFGVCRYYNSLFIEKVIEIFILYSIVFVILMLFEKFVGDSF
jgi:predicted lipase